MIAVVCPSNRPARLKVWREAWAWEDQPGVSLYVVEDGPETWAAIDAELGRHAWVIPRQTDGIRCWGFLQAKRDGADYVVTLDDDCLPVDTTLDWLNGHLEALAMGATTWVASADVGSYRIRGMPALVEDRPIAANVGLWTGVPDLDAESQLRSDGEWDFRPSPEDTQIVPPGTYVPVSAMNLGVAPQYLPALWFGLQGRGPDGTPWGVDRFGDIWAGVVLKRVADHLGQAVRVGDPWVHHDRASDPHVNRVKEAEGKRLHEVFWRAVADVRLTRATVTGCVQEIAHRADLPDTAYWAKWREGLTLWADLC